ncbi:hypothetical protein [Pseudomonas sp. 58 R 12]|nr:hypothetical protein [Pseudomonas sp. 58 R 12]
MGVADIQALGRWRGLRRVAVEPLVYVEIVQLLGPQQPGQRLALHIARIVAGHAMLQGGVELVGLLTALFEQLTRVDLRRVDGRKTQIERFAFKARQFEDKTRRDLGAAVTANRRLHTLNHVIVDPILERPWRRLSI